VESADVAIDGGPLPQDRRLKVVDVVDRVSAASARNKGAAIARGSAFAFVDADVIVGPNWLSALIDTSDGLRYCVGGSVRNGTPDSGAGTAQYLLSLLDVHPNRSATPWHAVTGNMLVPRTLWERYGPFPENMNGGEDTLLSATAHRDGLLRFSRAAEGTHFNRTRTGEVIRQQYNYGRFTRAIAQRGPYRFRPLVLYRVFAPVAGIGRLVAVSIRALRWAELSPRAALRTAPVFVVSVAAWTAGLLRGPRARQRRSERVIAGGGLGDPR
jgi:GT2 family glycosyltransferase